MRVKIVKMGNSRGIRLPKPILEASGLSDEVELKVEGETIVLTPPHKNPREGWAEAFAALPPDDEDWSDWQNMRNGFDDTEWTWPEDHVWPEDPNTAVSTFISSTSNPSEAPKSPEGDPAPSSRRRKRTPRSAP